MVESILIPVVSLTVTAIVLGGCIVFVSKKFYVYEDPLIEKVTQLLPGANCGACGYPGCAQLAAALVETKDATAVCPVADEETMAKIGEVLGMTLSGSKPLVCTVRCHGSSAVSKKTAHYHGIMDCWAALQVFHGTKVCPYACIGLGSCLNACNYDALSLSDGLVHVDGERCVGCGLCINECPTQVLEITERSEWRYYVACSSRDKGNLTRKYCEVGCIACQRCVKECPADAIIMENNCAVIDQDACVACGICADVCPTNSIVLIHDSLKAKDR